MSNAVVLLSGGLDSVVSLALIRKYCNNILALTFDYGQKSFFKEKIAAENISKHYEIEHKTIDIKWLGEISNSALNTNSDVPIINEADLDNMEVKAQTAKSVWVPNRNGLFVNIAACFADSLKYDLIVIGANKEESETFKDNSINFINSINSALSNSAEYNVKLIGPVIYKNKQEIVADAIKLNVPFHLINSCYNDNENHCGKCESCLRLKRALEQNERPDLIELIFNKG